MKSNVEIHEFFVEGSDQERSHVLLHITEPGSPEEKEKGYFFAVAEINNGSLEQIEHLQQMIDDLETGYYETDDEENKNGFEITLEYINRRGHHILQYKNSLINCLVGVLRDNELSFAYHGSPNAILFYNENEEIQQMDILEEGEAELDGDHLFSSLMQGNMNDGDYFYLATPHINDFFTLDRIKKILSTRNTRQSASHIQKVLKDLDNDLSFGGILFHLPDKTELIKSGKRIKTIERGSVNSLDKLIDGERSTEEIMAPPLMGALKKRLNAYKEKRKLEKKKKPTQKKQAKNKKRGSVETNYRPRPADKPNESFINILLISLGKGLVTATIWIYKFFRKLLPILGKGLVGLILLITNKDGKRREVIASIQNYWDEKKDYFTSLPLLSKILFLITVILALVFIGSISTFKIRESRQAKLQTYINQVQAVMDKKTAAEASILYDDENKALGLLQEAQGLIKELPDNSRKEKDKVLELTTEIEASLMKLRKLETVVPEALIDLGQINPKAEVNHLSLIDNNLIIFGAEDKQLYKYDLENKNLEMKDHTTIPHLIKASTPKEEDNIVFLTGVDTIAEYNKENSTVSARDIAFPYTNTKLADLFIYNQRAYVLDPNNNQIYKHNATQTGFDKGSDWKRDETDIKNGVSLAIDGDIFVLTDNNLIKFAGGEKMEFNITGLDPQLNKPSQVWTYNNVNNIYILEPTNKRVIVLNKEGKLKTQYTAEHWQNPTGMVIDELSGVIYILDNNIIYKFNY